MSTDREYLEALQQRLDTVGACVEGLHTGVEELRASLRRDDLPTCHICGDVPSAWYSLARRVCARPVCIMAHQQELALRGVDDDDAERHALGGLHDAREMVEVDL